jgi:hypothetical protein
VVFSRRYSHGFKASAELGTGVGRNLTSPAPEGNHRRPRWRLSGGLGLEDPVQLDVNGNRVW